MAEPDKKSMKGWGLASADHDTPKTLEEAQLTALIVIADRLNEIGLAILNIQDRIVRIEIWLEQTSPTYKRSQEETKKNQDMIQALRAGGVKVT